MNAIATDFASNADLENYKRTHSLATGDNGIGCWNDLTAQRHTPMCALAPSVIRAQWKTLGEGKHRKVTVIANGRSVVCILADILPESKADRIDLNPAALEYLRLRSPIRLPVQWFWA